MQIQRAFQDELRPNGATRRAFVRFAGAKRFVWNKALAEPKYLGYAENCKLLIQWKVEHPWMREAHSQVLQQALKDLDKAFERGAEQPKAKKKWKARDSFLFPQGFRLEESNRRVYLPKIGWPGLSVRHWSCPYGAEHDRDVNAAVNTLIAAAGYAVEVDYA